MFFHQTLPFLLILLALKIRAQEGTFIGGPTCLEDCGFSTAEGQGCAFTDPSCFCNETGYQETVIKCVLDECSQANINVTRELFIQVCDKPWPLDNLTQSGNSTSMQPFSTATTATGTASSNFNGNGSGTETPFPGSTKSGSAQSSPTGASTIQSQTDAALRSLVSVRKVLALTALAALGGLLV